MEAFAAVGKSWFWRFGVGAAGGGGDVKVGAVQRPRNFCCWKLDQFRISVLPSGGVVISAGGSLWMDN